MCVYIWHNMNLPTLQSTGILLQIFEISYLLMGCRDTCMYAYYTSCVYHIIRHHIL